MLEINHPDVIEAKEKLYDRKCSSNFGWFYNFDQAKIAHFHCERFSVMTII